MDIKNAPAIDKHIFLASRSPRRAHLLEQLGIQFRQESLDVEETYPDELDIHLVAGYLAEKKAHAHRSLLRPNEILLAADSVVIMDNKILEKPLSEKHALEMLAVLSDGPHEVRTGICFMTASDKLVLTDTTTVWFDKITDEEIAHYVRKFAPYDKAGGYGIQDWIGWAKIKRIEGSYSNVMGLPTHLVYESLLRFSNT